VQFSANSCKFSTQKITTGALKFNFAPKLTQDGRFPDPSFVFLKLNP